MEKYALFCVNSPLQAICAYEALNYYSITKYDFLVLEDGIRNMQVEEFFKSKNIAYQVTPYHPSDLESLKRILCVFRNKGKYDILFFGDYKLISPKLKYLPFLKSGGSLIYLDDGNGILSIDQGYYHRKMSVRIRDYVFNSAVKYRKISDYNFFTIYADDIKNTSWKIEKNTFASLNSIPKKQGNVIYIIGTATQVYCSFLGIKEEDFFDKQQRLIDYIRTNYPDDEIVFLPHGRDVSENTAALCARNNIAEEHTACCAELYLLSKGVQPKAIFGYTSSALYTLHMLFPKVPVYNVFWGGKNSFAVDSYKEIIKTYDSKDIRTISPP